MNYYTVLMSGISKSIAANSTLEAAHTMLSSHGLKSARSIAVRTYHQTIEYRDCLVVNDVLEYSGSSVIDKLEIDWTSLALGEE